MKFLITSAVVGIISLSSANLFAQTEPVSPGTGGVTTQPVTSGAGYGSASQPTTNPNSSAASLGVPAPKTPTSTEADESNTDARDDSLYRGRTSETANPMLRDEGPLHFKTRPKEKVQEV